MHYFETNTLYRVPEDTREHHARLAVVIETCLPVRVTLVQLPMAPDDAKQTATQIKTVAFANLLEATKPGPQ